MTAEVVPAAVAALAGGDAGTASPWGREDDPAEAVRRILDAAGRVFADRGVASARMGEVARAAGCSRGTLYRYFPDRDALRLAYVEREARRVGAVVATVAAGAADPPARLVDALVAALAEVRSSPELLAWFTPDAAGTAGDVSRRASVVSSQVGAFLAALFAEAADGGRWRAPADLALATDWVVRVVLSLLAQPGADAASERRLLDELLAPALFQPVR